MGEWANLSGSKGDAMWECGPHQSPGGSTKAHNLFPSKEQTTPERELRETLRGAKQQVGGMLSG